MWQVHAELDVASLTFEVKADNFGLAFEAAEKYIEKEAPNFQIYSIGEMETE